MPARRITIPPLKEFTSSDLAKHCSSERRVGQSGAPAAPLARAVPVATAAHRAPFQCPWPPHLQRLDWEALSGAQALLSSAEAWMCGRRAACDSALRLAGAPGRASLSPGGTGLSPRLWRPNGSAPLQFPPAAAASSLTTGPVACMAAASSVRPQDAWVWRKVGGSLGARRRAVWEARALTAPRLWGQWVGPGWLTSSDLFLLHD